MLSAAMTASDPSRARCWCAAVCRWTGVGALLLLSCPAPPPASSRRVPQDDGVAARDHGAPTPPAPPSDGPGVAPAAPLPGPSPAPTDDTADDAMSLPPALAAEGVSPVARTLWRGLEGVDAGEATAMDAAMAAGARWFPPGSAAESISVDTGLSRAMNPWTGAQIQLDLRRVVDLGPNRIVAQLSVFDDTSPALRYEMALVVDAQGDRIAAIRQYGDALGPLRPRPEDPGKTLELGPVGDLEITDGPPTVAHVVVTNRLMDALARRDDAAAAAELSPAVVLHDVLARRRREGAQAYASAYRASLGEHGRATMLHQHATRSFVVVEGAIAGRGEERDGVPLEHGFADIHRLEEGRIVETWRYVNRRGRPAAADAAAIVNP